MNINTELLKKTFEIMLKLMITLDQIKSEKNKETQKVIYPNAIRLNVFDLEELEKMDEKDQGYETS